ncbi:hypothetical protein J7E96_30930 [Streptomyces sp. ISL-96]|uniref:hypothetical protein n=1 Tax=Streptomyces sp. ISL-96 TaxID=2819191 RepID=UPI001BEB487A|nr:hypothetical protein [Streptomyces sp. ISL-96]MBT2492848.1 hypothetical protein [Streptomyces sp. ISL-96]
MIARPTSPGSPIYDQLVMEHGDVLTEARRLADLTHQQADRVLTWDKSTLRGDQAAQS